MLGHHRVLIVDDDRDVADAMGTLLEIQGAEVVIALSAADARHALQTTSFDCVTLDLMMPGESGVDFWHYLRAKYPVLAARVVFFTGDFSPDTQRFLESTGRPVLTKPCTSTDLRATVRRTLAREPTPAEYLQTRAAHRRITG